MCYLRYFILDERAVVFWTTAFWKLGSLIQEFTEHTGYMEPSKYLFPNFEPIPKYIMKQAITPTRNK